MREDTNRPPTAGTAEGQGQQNTPQSTPQEAKSQGLVPRGPVKQLDLRQAADKINILGSKTVFQVGDGLLVRAVYEQLSAKPEDGDVYPAIGRPGELSISKIGLLKLASAKGVIWSPVESRVVDDAAPCSACVDRAMQRNQRPICPHNIGYRAVGAWLDATGSWEIHSATKYWNWDEELEEVRRTYRNQLRNNKITEAQFDAKVQEEFNKRFRDRYSLAETKAKLRVVREIGIKPAYTPQELAKGFIAVRVEPELSRTQAQQRGLQSAAQIFGTHTAADAPGLDFSHATELPDEEAVGASALGAEEQPVAPPSEVVPPASPEPEPQPPAETKPDPQTQAAQPPAGVNTRQRGVGYECPGCLQCTVKYIPAGTNKQTQKAYNEFWVCENKDCTGGKDGQPWRSWDYAKDAMEAFNGGGS